MCKRALRRLPTAQKSILPLIYGASLLIFSSVAHAGRPGDLATKWPVNDDDPSMSVPSVEQRNSDPLEFGYFLQDLIARANTAYDAGNWSEAVKYYEAMAKAVPDVATAYSRLCVAYAKVDRQDLAIAHCAKATALPFAKVFDHLHYLDLLLRQPELSPADIASADASLKHLREHAAQHPQLPPGVQGGGASSEDELIAKVREDVQQRRREREAAGTASSAGAPAATAAPSASGAPASVPQPASATPTETAAKEARAPGRHLPTEIELLACKLASRIGDDQRLTSCIAALRENKANERLLLPFLWTQALNHRDEARANQLMKEAAGHGLPEATITAMQDEQDEVFGNFRRVWKYIAGFVVLIGLAAVAFSLRHRFRKPIPPQPHGVSTEA